MNIDLLNTELTVDPLGRGYSTMDNEAAAADLNTAYRSRNKTQMTGSEILNAIDKDEFLALTDTQQRRVWDIIHIGVVDPFGIEADLFVDVFGGASATITALAAARTEPISRAEELVLGTVKPGHVEEARR